MIERIALHTTYYLNTLVYISTVKMYGKYETMVMFEDGDELESFTSSTLEEARKTHNDTVNRWNDKIYEGSTAKLLGAPNLGQFVKTHKAC